MEVLLNTGHMCRALPWVCVCGDFPGECDITQHGLLSGVLLLLPATPLLESMILHTHTLAPTEVTPTGPNFPLHLQRASSVSTYMCVSVCDPAVCPHARRLNQCSLQKVRWGLCLCQPADQSKEASPQHPRRLTGQSKGAARGKGLSPGL